MYKKIPIHLFIPDKVKDNELLLETIKIASEHGISFLWVEVEEEKDLIFLEKISSINSIVAVIKNVEILKIVIEKGISRIVITPFIVEKLLQLSENYRRKIERVYITLTFNTQNEQRFVDKLNQLVLRADELRKSGIEVFINFYHPDPVVHFNVSLLMKQRYQTKHVITFTTCETGEESVLLNGLSLGSMFYEGIGEEILLWVSPSTNFDERVTEMVGVIKKVLGALGLFPKGYSIISCPTCGRCRMDLLKMTEEINRKFHLLEKQYKAEGKELEKVGGLTVAVMGCNVNGPGEARNADIGIAGKGNKTGILFKNGKPFKTLPENNLVDELILYVRAIIDHKFRVAI